MVFSRADREEKNTATVGYSNEKRHPERIAISPKLVSSHFIKVRCRSCNDLLDNVSHDQRNLNDANNSKKPSSPITSRNTDRSIYNPNFYQSVTERFYNSDVRTKCYVSRSLSPQSAAITVNCETYSGPMMQDPCRSPELLEATDSREWRQIIEQQRLPNAGDTIGKNRMNADSKFRIVHSSAGSLKESLLNSSSWSSARSLRSTGLGDVSKLNNTGMSAVESLKPKNTTSVLRTSVEVLHRFPDQTHCRSTEAERPSEVLSSDGGREQCCSNAKPSEPVVAVSGKHRCSHCQMELGRGAAMIIESLNLFYHLGCFRCYVCNRSLGNGTQGADVRVRQSKLHCQTCYSNDEAGLKFSQV
uniref:LIM and calponiny domains-containing protein 1 n=1 Tax=Ascaris suum TaxID=6253 RepID=F1L4I5_ASCSU